METGVIVAIAAFAAFIFFAIFKKLMKLAFFGAVIIIIAALIYSQLR